MALWELRISAIIDGITMTFTEPLPLTEILARLDAKTPIGSILRTSAWEAMPQALRDSAFFSAGVTDAAFLSAQQQAIRDMIARAKGVNESGQEFWKMDRSRFIRDLRVMGESIGIAHPDGREHGIKEKDITDPLSIARLKLVVNTQLEMAYGEGQWRTAMDETLLNEWPAWELVRISPRRVPRDWLTRWSEAADAIGWEGVSREAFKQGRMIALKTSLIWIKLSRFNRPHPPFDFNSGMGVEEVDRDTAESFRLMSMSTENALNMLGKMHLLPTEELRRGRFNADAPQSLTPNVRAFEESLEASLKGVPDVLRRKLKGIFKDQIDIDGDSVRWNPRQVTFKQPPTFEPGKGGGRVEVEAKLARAIEAAVLNRGAADVGAMRPLQGVPDDAAERIREFERSVRDKLLEHARLYNAAGDEIDRKIGTAEQVSFPPESCPQAIMTHRHGNNTPPGQDDLIGLLMQNMLEVRSVAEDGVHSIRPGAAGTGTPVLVDALNAWRALDPAVDAVMTRLHRAHQWSGAEYARSYLQSLYSVLAERGLLSYSFEPFL